MQRLAASYDQSPVRFVKIDSSKQLEDTFSIGEKLGEGSFGSVLLAVRLADGEKFAVKKVAKQKEAKSTYGKSWENEIRVLRRFQHENLIRLDVIYESENNCYLFMEFCDRGTLSDELQRGGRFVETDALCHLRQLGNAMLFLHRKCIVHRDLKLQNCLLRSKLANASSSSSSNSNSNSGGSSSNSRQQLSLKLTDFGLSIELRDADQSLVDNVGTPAYQAPEVVSGNSYGYKCDMWSFGIVFYWLLHAESPYRCRSEAELQEAIRGYRYEQHWQQCSVCSGVSAECRRALGQLLVPAPLDRWSASEFAASGWATQSAGAEASSNIFEMMRTLNKAKQSGR